MFLHRLHFVILFIPIVIGIETIENKVKSTVKSNVVETLLPKKQANNSVTNFELLSEGGSIIPHVSISQEVNDLGSTSKSVKGRKGVNFTLDNSADHKLKNGTENKNTPSETPSPTPTPTKKDVLTEEPIYKNIHTNPVKNVTTSTIKKPLVLVYEALPTPKAEKTLVSLNIELAKKATTPGSHPDLIMPIVITILVVPMFAVLVYLAFKRGQDAWKNRHYKRMDFLLDGMYND